MRRLLRIATLLLLAGTALGQSGNIRLLNKGREGEVFNVAEYLVEGKLNIVEFQSGACPICRALAPKLAALAGQKGELALGLVSIDRPASQGIDWQSPIARQYELRSVPQFKIYDLTGKLVAEGEPARKMVAGLLIEAGLI
jgi:hypothetical protein